MADVNEGGNRERLRLFLMKVASAGYEIRGLLDADQSQLISEDLPSNAWITDLRDIEGYVLAEENVEIALRLGWGIDGISASSLTKSMSETAAFLAAVRIVSHRMNLQLPVSRSRFKGYITANGTGSLRLDRTAYLRALLRAADISLREQEDIDRAISAAMDEIAGIPIEKVRHGKDCMRLLTVQFRSVGASDLTDVAPLLWSSFRQDRLIQYPVLREILKYLNGR